MHTLTVDSTHFPPISFVVYIFLNLCATCEDQNYFSLTSDRLKSMVRPTSFKMFPLVTSIDGTVLRYRYFRKLENLFPHHTQTIIFSWGKLVSFFLIQWASSISRHLVHFPHRNPMIYWFLFPTTFLDHKYIRTSRALRIDMSTSRINLTVFDLHTLPLSGNIWQVLFANVSNNSFYSESLLASMSTIIIIHTRALGKVL